MNKQQQQQQQQSLHPGATPFNTDDEFPLVSGSHHTLRVELFLLKRLLFIPIPDIPPYVVY